jgi:hypothetical protein
MWKHADEDGIKHLTISFRNKVLMVWIDILQISFCILKLLPSYTILDFHDKLGLPYYRVPYFLGEWGFPATDTSSSATWIKKLM